jgi:hypothetical protein
LGIGHRQRSEEDGIQEAVDGGIRPDAERERRHRKQGEQLVALDRTQAVAQILR